MSCCLLQPNRSKTSKLWRSDCGANGAVGSNRAIDNVPPAYGLNWWIRLINRQMISYFGLLSLAAAFTFILTASPRAWGYRPFDSTDAAVAESNEIEVQLGYFTIKREGGETIPVIPKVELDYGILGNFEAEGEFEVEEPPDEGGVQLEDPEFSLKAVIRHGVLQGVKGPSIALELGLLLPSTEKGESDLGFKGVGILSDKISFFTFHVNLGGGADRENRNPFALWGVIGEAPVSPTFRFVGEFNGKHPDGGSYNNSGLLGFIWYSKELNSSFDAGVRKGISGETPDWEFTTGVTFSF